MLAMTLSFVAAAGILYFAFQAIWIVFLSFLRGLMKIGRLTLWAAGVCVVLGLLANPEATVNVIFQILREAIVMTADIAEVIWQQIQNLRQ